MTIPATATTDAHGGMDGVVRAGPGQGQGPGPSVSVRCSAFHQSAATTVVVVNELFGGVGGGGGSSPTRDRPFLRVPRGARVHVTAAVGPWKWWWREWEMIE